MEQVDIPGFTDLKLIGRGGSAMVFSARQPRLERNVAIKVLRSASLDENSRRLFDAERVALGKLSDHANIVSVFDSGFTTNDEPYLVMQYCAGGSLTSLVRQSGPLEIEHAMRIGLKIAQALEFAHRLGTLHRDVKPENILISDLGEPLLSDFGIAAVLENGGATSDGAMSPHYVAPEEFTGGRQSASTDLYSLGSTLFFLLTGRAPHQVSPSERLSQSEIFSRVSDLNYPVDLPRSVDAPPKCRRALQSVLVKDPRRRLQDASMAVDFFSDAEAELDTSRRKLLLPVNAQGLQNETAQANRPGDQRPDEEDRYADADPDQTIARVKSTWQPPDYVNPVRPSGQDTANTEVLSERKTGPRFRNRSDQPGSNDSLGGFRSLSDSDRVSRATAQPKSTANHQSLDDDDRTVVAGARAKPQSVTSSDPRLASEVQKASGQRSWKPVLVAALVVVVAIAALTLGVKGKESDLKSSSDTAPATLAAVAVSAPVEVQTRPIGFNAVEVSWTGSPVDGVQYDVAMNRGSKLVGAKTGVQSPVTFEGLDLSAWLPCFEVSAIETATNYVASADPECVEAPNVSTTSSAGEVIP
jgi:serine/threonine-protein kinase PknK